MTDLEAVSAAGTAPSQLRLEPPLLLALGDRFASHGGQPKWDAEWGLDMAARRGVEGLVPDALRAAVASLTPAPPGWFGRRLTMLWTMFMLGRSADEGAQTVWMAETARLLGDVPHAVIAHAIDQAVRTCRHGFIPSVGEIMGVAEPLVAERKQQVERLSEMAAALADPAATTARAERRRVRALMAEAEAR